MPPGRRGGPGPGRARGPGRRHRRRRMRRVRRRRVIIGGALVFAIGSSAYKLSQKDADQIESASGKKVEDMTEQELQGYMDKYQIEDMEVTDSDAAALESDGDAPQQSTPTAQPAPAAQQPQEDDYTVQLTRLAELHDQGILTDEEFDTKKKQILGL